MYRIFAFIILFGLLAGCKKSDEKNPGNKGFISLSPNITETMYAIGAGDQLLAVTDFCSWPPAVEKKERIGGFINPNIEKILMLRPSHLLGLPSHKDLAEKLSRHDLTVIMLPNESISDVMMTIDSLGRLTGNREKAVRLQHSLNDSLDAYRYRGKVAPEAMLVIGRQAGIPRNITVAAPGSFIHEVWTRTGGLNVFEDLGNRYGMVNREAILVRDPDLIIEFRQLEPSDSLSEMRIRNEWLHLDLLSAVQQGKVHILSGDYCLIPGPRMYLLARDFSRILSGINNK